MSQTIVKKIGLVPTEESPPRTVTADGGVVASYSVHRTVIRAKDSYGEAREATHRLVGLYILDYELILGMEWLAKEDPDLQCPERR